MVILPSGRVEIALIVLRYRQCSYGQSLARLGSGHKRLQQRKMTRRKLKVMHTYSTQGTTVQLICFLLSEFPVQLLIKRYGFKQILPLMMMGWGTVSWGQAFMTNKTGFYITRALIGMDITPETVEARC